MDVILFGELFFGDILLSEILVKTEAVISVLLYRQKYKNAHSTGK